MVVRVVVLEMTLRLGFNGLGCIVGKINDLIGIIH